MNNRPWLFRGQGDVDCIPPWHLDIPSISAGKVHAFRPGLGSRKRGTNTKCGEKGIEGGRERLGSDRGRQTGGLDGRMYVGGRCGGGAGFTYVCSHCPTKSRSDNPDTWAL